MLGVSQVGSQALLLVPMNVQHALREKLLWLFKQCALTALWGSIRVTLAMVRAKNVTLVRFSTKWKSPHAPPVQQATRAPIFTLVLPLPLHSAGALVLFLGSCHPHLMP